MALFLKIEELPEHAVTDALGYLRDRGLRDDREASTTQQLVDQLLDSAKTRSATVEVLRMWVMGDSLPEIVDDVRPRLEAPELARLEPDSDI